jgi:CDP-diacylglycerol--serine O-phosphatidyltransferase
MIEPAKKNPRRRRGIYILPTLFTIGTIFGGFYAVVSTLKGEFNLAAIAIGLAVVCDGLDGRIARLTNSCSEFGMQLDSLADVLTFGMAPAVLAYVWGLKSIMPSMPTYGKELQQLGWILCFGYVICGAMRLARFNIQSIHPHPDSTKKAFVGMPIPAGAGLVAAIVHFSPEPLTHWLTGWLWIILIGLLSFLMVSTIRYPSFKHLNLRDPKSKFTVLLLAMLVALICLFSQYTLLILASVYASSGLFNKLIHIRRRPDPVSIAQPMPSPGEHAS